MHNVIRFNWNKLIWSNFYKEWVIMTTSEITNCSKILYPLNRIVTYMYLCTHYSLKLSAKFSIHFLFNSDVLRIRLLSHFLFNRLKTNLVNFLCFCPQRVGRPGSRSNCRTKNVFAKTFFVLVPSVYFHMTPTIHNLNHWSKAMD